MKTRGIECTGCNGYGSLEGDIRCPDGCRDGCQLCVLCDAKATEEDEAGPLCAHCAAGDYEGAAALRAEQAELEHEAAAWGAWGDAMAKVLP